MLGTRKKRGRAAMISGVGILYKELRRRGPSQAKPKSAEPSNVSEAGSGMRVSPDEDDAVVVIPGSEGKVVVVTAPLAARETRPVPAVKSAL
jgi:hypothetical protein